MHLTLSPSRGLPGGAQTELAVAGDTLSVDGVAYDLSPVPEGGAGIPRGVHSFLGTITRQGGLICATVRVHVDDAVERRVLDDPARWVIAEAEGPVGFPVAESGQ